MPGTNGICGRCKCWNADSLDRMNVPGLCWARFYHQACTGDPKFWLEERTHQRVQYSIKHLVVYKRGEYHA